jgi:hypothetical protein
MTLTYQWRGDFTNHEVNLLHAEAFGTKVFDESEWNWVELVYQHSLGWVVARDGTILAGFINIVWDGCPCMAARHHGRGCGTRPGHRYRAGRSRTARRPGSGLRVPARGLRRSPGCVLPRRLRLPANQRRTAGAELRSHWPEPTTSSLSDHLGLVVYQPSCSSATRSNTTTDRWRPFDSGRSGTHLARHRADRLGRLSSDP